MLGPDDYVVHETEYQTRCATVVLIDMSGSMGRYGKYYTTKKVALALQAMVRARYPQDSLQMIGFYTFANLMNERQLLGSAPKPVSLFDSRVHMRFDLDHPPGAYPSISPISTPAFAWPGASCRASLLQTSRSSSSPMVNRRRTSKGGKLCSIYPPAEKTAAHTLAEARNCANRGIRVSSFALIEDYFYLGLVNFVEEMARVSRGVAAYCSADEVGNLVFESFQGGRRTRRYQA